MSPSDSSPAFSYVGQELELFQLATNWKQYLAEKIRPFLGATVIEVGAGLGANVRFLHDGQSSWLCVEPDSTLADTLRAAIASGGVPFPCDVMVGTLNMVPQSLRVSAILYIDVLEHIQNDLAEVEAAQDRLLPGGRLVVLSPACPWLFSPFDTAVGHYRRYTASGYRRLTTSGLELTSLKYLDSAGMAASAANKVFLRAGLPTRRQVMLWDQVLVPISRILDRMIGYRMGKSLLGVWTKRG